MIPESVESRERWRASLDTYLARKERIRKLRAELTECRRLGKERRHAERLRRARATTKESR